MNRPIAMLILLSALLTTSCGLKIDMPTLSSVDSPNAVAISTREAAR